MPRTSILEDVIKIASDVPWWLTIAIGGGCFYVFKHYLPKQMSGPYQHTWEPMFSVLAYVFLGAFLVGALISLGRRFREVLVHRSQSSIHSIRTLSWSDFGLLMVEAYRRQGYKAKRTVDGPDGGIDIILRRNGETTLVQCKQWKASRVGVKPIRELAGVVFGEKHMMASSFVLANTQIKPLSSRRNPASS